MKFLAYPMIFLVKLYQKLISPFTPATCRFQPTCSQYCIDSLKTYGIIKGLLKSAKRIMKCNPWFGYGGYDPVKKEKEVK